MPTNHLGSSKKDSLFRIIEKYQNPPIRARRLVVNDLFSESKGSQFDSGC